VNRDQCWDPLWRHPTDHQITHCQKLKPGSDRVACTIDQLLSLRLIAEKYQECDKRPVRLLLLRRFSEGLQQHLADGPVANDEAYRVRLQSHSPVGEPVQVNQECGQSQRRWQYVQLVRDTVRGPPGLCSVSAATQRDAGVVMALADVDEAGILVSGTRISRFHFAGDISFLADGQLGSQQQISQLHSFSTRFVLKISISKTEVQRISGDPRRIKISIGGTELNQVDQFIYLG